MPQIRGYLKIGKITGVQTTLHVRLWVPEYEQAVNAKSTDGIRDLSGRLRQWEAHSEKEGWLVDIMLLVAQDTNSAGLQHHHRQREVQGILQPPLNEGSEKVAM